MRLLMITFCVFFSGILFAQRAEAYKPISDRARSLTLQGKYPEAILAFDSAIRIMPYYPALYKDRGYAHLQMKDYPSAALDFTVVLDKQPWQHEVRMLRGVAYLNNGQAQPALDDFRRIKQDDPENTRVDPYLAQAVSETESEVAGNIEVQQARMRLEEERYYEMRRREEVIWGTVVPLLFWATVFATW